MRCVASGTGLPWKNSINSIYVIIMEDEDRPEPYILFSNNKTQDLGGSLGYVLDRLEDKTWKEISWNQWNQDCEDMPSDD